jgi:flagellar basal-body rod protein FlgF
MIRGIYAAASGMLVETIRNDAIANNLANVNTTGYKKNVALSKDFASVLVQRINDGDQALNIGSMGMGAVVNEITTVQSKGALRFTGNKFDLAVEGQGFFMVQTPFGIRYTRNGEFTRNEQGELVNSEGYRVLGENGVIRINGNNLHISDDGQLVVDDNPVDRLQIVDFAEPKNLIKEGVSLFNAESARQQRLPVGKVKQGYLEASNVNVVREMVDMLAGYRAYELNSKLVQAHDQLLEKAANEIGKV